MVACKINGGSGRLKIAQPSTSIGGGNRRAAGVVDISHTSPHSPDRNIPSLVTLFFDDCSPVHDVVAIPGRECAGCALSCSRIGPRAKNGSLSGALDRKFAGRVISAAVPCPMHDAICSYSQAGSKASSFR